MHAFTQAQTFQLIFVHLCVYLELACILCTSMFNYYHIFSHFRNDLCETRTQLLLCSPFLTVVRDTYFVALTQYLLSMQLF